MRRLSVAVAAVMLMVVAAGPAAANGPPVVFTDPPFSFPDVNPCTGLVHLVTVTPTVAIHAFETSDPDLHHLTVHLTLDVVTDDGFSGQGVQTFIDNGHGPFSGETGLGMFQDTFNVNLSNATGQRIKVHGVFHFNQVDGSPVADFGDFSLKCVGKPA